MIKYSMEKKTIEFKVIKQTGVEKVVLSEIAADERDSKKYLGTALGLDVAHCVDIGGRHYKGDFLAEAKWYYINSEIDEHLEELRKTQPSSIKVEFYGNLEGERNDK